MNEIGIAISGQHSKTIEELGGTTFDGVITVCNRAAESCPTFSAATLVLHRGFDHPPAPAPGAENKEKALVHYRRVRDEIKNYILTLPRTPSGD